MKTTSGRSIPSTNSFQETINTFFCSRSNRRSSFVSRSDDPSSPCGLRSDGAYGRRLLVYCSFVIMYYTWVIYFLYSVIFIRHFYLLHKITLTLVFRVAVTLHELVSLGPNVLLHIILLIHDRIAIHIIKFVYFLYHLVTSSLV